MLIPPKQSDAMEMAAGMTGCVWLHGCVSLAIKENAAISTRGTKGVMYMSGDEVSHQVLVGAICSGCGNEACGKSSVQAMGCSKPMQKARTAAATNEWASCFLAVHCISLGVKTSQKLHPHRNAPPKAVAGPIFRIDVRASRGSL